jgi:hypothetical protein
MVTTVFHLIHVDIPRSNSLKILWKILEYRTKNQIRKLYQKVVIFKL